MEALSTKECVEQAWARVLIDFRQWCGADNKHLLDWKRRPLSQAIAVCPGRMVDSAEDMLSKWRQSSDSKESGSTSSLPVLLFAVARVSSPPEVQDLKAVPYWLDVVLPHDPQKRMMQLRTIAQQYRVQMVFVSPDADSPSSLMNQFCAYLSDDFKRRFPVTYHFGDGLSDQFDMTVLNAPYPDTVPTESKNQSIALVDVMMMGLVPQVVGLGDADTDVAGRKPDEALTVVVQADIDHYAASKITRIDADAATGESTLSEVDRL